ncbi:hypothetical protein [Staphylococcus equorum]|nr:hypothetical protein [Staphylococcus equorum]
MKENIIFRGVNNMRERENVKWKGYEIAFFIISIIFLFLASINLLGVTKFSQSVESVFYSIFLLSMFIVNLRKSLIISLLFLVAGVLFFISIF